MSFDWSSFLDHTLQMPAADLTQPFNASDPIFGDLGAWVNSEADIDWIAWDSQVPWM